MTQCCNLRTYGKLGKKRNLYVFPLSPFKEKGEKDRPIAGYL